MNAYSDFVSRSHVSLINCEERRLEFLSAWCFVHSLFIVSLIAVILYLPPLLCGCWTLLYLLCLRVHVH